MKISGFPSQALSLGNSDTVQVGDSVYAVGNPQGLEGTFSQGIVNSSRELGSDKLPMRKPIMLNRMIHDPVSVARVRRKKTAKVIGNSIRPPKINPSS